MWNPSDFGGQTQLSISSDLIWKPDITVINSPNVFRFDSQLKEATFLLYSNGTVQWFPQTEVKTYCMTDLTYYPEDTQKCRISIEPFYEYKYVDFGQYKDMTTYLVPQPYSQNPQWQIISAQSK